MNGLEAFCIEHRMKPEAAEALVKLLHSIIMKENLWSANFKPHSEGTDLLKAFKHLKEA